MWWGSYGINPWHELKYESWAHIRGLPHCRILHQAAGETPKACNVSNITLEQDNISEWWDSSQVKNLWLTCLSFTEDITALSSWRNKDSSLNASVWERSTGSGFAYSECWCQITNKALSKALNAFGVIWDPKLQIYTWSFYSCCLKYEVQW